MARSSNVGVISDRVDRAVERSAKRFELRKEEPIPVEEPVVSEPVYEQVVPLEPTLLERLERLEQVVERLRCDVMDLRYLLQQVNNRVLNGELSGYALEYVNSLDQRVTHIENYLRYITTGQL